MSVTHLSALALRRALEIRDLTDPAQGPHAVQLLIAEVETALGDRWGIEVRRERAHPIVSLEENYDRLLVPPDAVGRDARYTRYVNDRAVLRTMTSAIVPLALDRLAAAAAPEEVLVSCPGLVWRRDAIDRRHVGEPHQLDLWRVRTGGPPLERGDLREMIAAVVAAVVPGRLWRDVPAEHPYTTGGMQIDARASDGAWVEIGECGLAHPGVLGASGLQAPPASGLAMGLGLDRLLMLRKGIDDIRLLRSIDPRVSDQMLDLLAYRPVSAMPAVRRDLSIAVGAGATAEDLGDRVRAAFGAGERGGGGRGTR